jgi:hypothetical protein
MEYPVPGDRMHLWWRLHTACHYFNKSKTTNTVTLYAKQTDLEVQLHINDIDNNCLTLNEESLMSWVWDFDGIQACTHHQIIVKAYHKTMELDSPTDRETPE